MSTTEPVKQKTEKGEAPPVQAIEIVQLFGQYDYLLPSPSHILNNATILYGNNGAGKTTILRLVYHLLSPENDKGHRTYLYKAPFRKLRVRLRDNIIFAAMRVDKSEGAFGEDIMQLTVSRGDELLATWNYGSQEKDLKSTSYNKSEVERLLAQPSDRILGVGNEAYLAALRRYSPVVFMLDADRRLNSDALDEMKTGNIEPSFEDVGARFLSLSRHSSTALQDVLEQERQASLLQVLTRAAQTINRKLLKSADQGSLNVHTVYVNIVDALLMGPRPEAPAPMASGEELLIRLSEVEKTAQRYSAYGLTAPLDLERFRSALSSSIVIDNKLLITILEPYIRSLEGRFNAVKSTYDILERFIALINSFLEDKEVVFSPEGGLKVVSRVSGQQISLTWLSSGERQLLLLFCHVLVSLDHASVFMIDEPEISLNVKWQRKLISALLNVVRESDTQFIFASHSMELLAQHRDRVVVVKGGSRRA